MSIKKTRAKHRSTPYQETKVGLGGGGGTGCGGTGDGGSSAYDMEKGTCSVNN